MIERVWQWLGDQNNGYDPLLATGAGLAASGAYLVEMAVDLPALGCPTNDLLLLGGMVTDDGRIWPLLGAVLHCTFGVGLAHGYAAVQRRLPGPPWAKGLGFALAENTTLSLLLPLFDRFHPAIRAGKLPQMVRPIPILQQVLRHIAYGIVLGAVYGRGRRDGR